MVGAETVERENKEKDEMTDAANVNVEKTAEENGDVELAGNTMTSDYEVKVSTELPLPSFSLSVSSGFAKSAKIRKFCYAEALASCKSQVPTVVKHYLGSKIGDDLQKVLQRHTANLIQKYSVKPAPEPSKIQTPKSDLEPESEKSASEIFKIKKEQVEKQKMPKYTIKSTDKATLKDISCSHGILIDDENAMDKRVADMVKNHKRQHDDDEDPS
ncbi:hypothetical protein Tco_1572753, partial [Tanacetum coccineum]